MCMRIILILDPFCHETNLHIRHFVPHISIWTTLQYSRLTVESSKCINIAVSPRNGPVYAGMQYRTFLFLNFIPAFINICYIHLSSRVAQSVQCLATDWMTRRSGFDPRQGQRIFPLSSMPKPALGPTQPPVQWVPGVLSPGVKRGRGATLTTHRI
jgi:hypothetical protein